MYYKEYSILITQKKLRNVLLFLGHRQIFPEAELSKGHLLMCLNVDLQTLNAITAIVRHTEPNILKFTLPDHMMTDLPEWTLIETAAGMDQMQE